MVTMSQKEFQRVKVIENEAGGRLGLREASRLLQLSERQVQRLKRRYRSDSVDWVLRRRGPRTFAQLDGNIRIDLGDASLTALPCRSKSSPHAALRRLLRALKRMTEVPPASPTSPAARSGGPYLSLNVRDSVSLQLIRHFLVATTLRSDLYPSSNEGS
jgi:hypothetical protein